MGPQERAALHREVNITACVRFAWIYLNMEKLNRDARAIGTLKAVGRQRSFVKRVRELFYKMSKL